MNLFSASKPLLEKLSNDVKEIVHLVERDGNEVVYLHKFEPLLRPISITSSVGLHNPMYCTGVGKSIMAYLPEKEVRAIWDGTQVIPFTPKTITTWEALQEDLSCVRERGYAIDDEEHDLGVRCIAAPIYNWNGTPVGAMSISGTVARMTPDKIEKFSPKLISTAEKISELMGWHARCIPFRPQQEKEGASVGLQRLPPPFCAFGTMAQGSVYCILLLLHCRFRAWFAFRIRVRGGAK